ncbi:MAG TPA: 4-hydroxy-tetrahydrodipicolinate synthase [Firmicutes bacterium]|jgi:4-hydroxy-tetrahydrodipicolinate synthase|nr:4-hydroxy-tetrahydrodipicolinate synthase [Bacillota bacterium]
MVEFGRVLTAMVTPLNEEGGIDYETAGKLARRLVENGSDGMVVAGTTGESPTLSEEEKLKLFAAVVEAVGGRAVVIAGTGTNNTQKSVELTKEAEKTGVDGIMAVAPYYNKPPQEGLYRHYRAIAEATSLPVMVYNVPGRTAVNISPATMARLAEVDNIIALKEASGDLNQAAEMVRVLPKDFLVYSGDDSMTLPMLSVGAVGIVSVASHLVGRRIASMINDYLQGAVEKATRAHNELLPLFKALFLTTNPIMVKAALNLLGVNVGSTRLPLVEATASELDALKEVLRGLGLL